MRIYTHLLLLALLTTTLYSCKKEEPLKEVNVNFYIHRTHHNFKDKLTCNIYSSKKDFANDNNVFKTITIEKNEEEKNVKGFQLNSYYYYDCFTDDYTTTSVLRYDIKEFSTATTHLAVSLDLDYRVTYRNQLFPNNAQHSTWKAIDCFDAAQVSQWNNIPTHIKDQTITFNRDLTLDYALYATNGTRIDSNMKFQVFDSFSPYITNAFTLNISNDPHKYLFIASGPYSDKYPYYYTEQKSLNDAYLNGTSPFALPESNLLYLTVGEAHQGYYKIVLFEKQP